MQYKYKVIYPVLIYDSDGNSAQIMKFKKDMARVVKKKDGTSKTHILFKNKWIEPIRQEDLKPGNKLIVLRFNDDGTYVTMPPFELDTVITGYEVDAEGNKVAITKKLPVKFEYLSNEERAWAILEMKESSTVNSDVEAQKRMLNYTIAAIVIGGLIVVAMVWLSTRNIGGLVSSLDKLAPSLQSIGNMVGVSPPG